jgi:hypothetical protein
MKLEKATIDVFRGSGPPDRITVLFNPFEYSIERSNTFKASSIPGLSGPLLHFINGEAEVLSMELFLDDYTDGPGPDGKDVGAKIDELMSAMEIDRDLHAPPQVQFVWGRLSFHAVIEKVSRKITMFHPDGLPARASLSVSFKECKDLVALTSDPPLQSADKTKRRVLVGRDSLWALAAREYGDPALWRVIARHNDIDDPREVSAGDWVAVPPLDKDDGAQGPL